MMDEETRLRIDLSVLALKTSSETWGQPGVHFRFIDKTLREHGYALGANHGWCDCHPVMVILISFPEKELLRSFGAMTLGEAVEMAWTFVKGLGAKRCIADYQHKLELIAQAAFELFDGEYAELEGQIKIPLTKEQKAKLRKLAESLHDAGYEWMTLT